MISNGGVLGAVVEVCYVQSQLCPVKMKQAPLCSPDVFQILLRCQALEGNGSFLLPHFTLTLFIVLGVMPTCIYRWR